MNRRSFMALASGLLVPELEPVRAYSFVGGRREHHLNDFILEGAGFPPITVGFAIDWLRKEGRAGVLTRPENVIVERLYNCDHDGGIRSIVRARIPALDRPPRHQLDGRTVS